MIDRKHFFDTVRADLFSDILTQGQVHGMEEILRQYEQSTWTEEKWLAYLLATVYHETGKTMQPTKERGGEAYLRSKKYYPYYGRDLMQTTWLANYKKVKAFTGVDVVANPALIGQLEMAVRVAFKFMEKGWYTGKKLADYFNAEKADWVNARRIINGTDRALDVASYGLKFLNAIHNDASS